MREAPRGEFGLTPGEAERFREVPLSERDLLPTPL